MPVRVFIVDDHQIMRQGVHLILREQPDLTVVGEAGECEVAWALIQKLQPELVVLDLEMPGEGGLALTRRIHGCLPNVKIIVLTGHAAPRLAREALAAGANGYVQKTNGGAELLAAVQSVLAGKVYLCVDTTTGLVGPTGHVPPNPFARPALSERELEVLRFVVAGCRNKEIAAEMNLGIKSVETYRSRLTKKLGCSTPAELVRCAVREGLAKL